MCFFLHATEQCLGLSSTAAGMMSKILSRHFLGVFYLLFWLTVNRICPFPTILIFLFFQANQDKILIPPPADWDQQPLNKEVFTIFIFVIYFTFDSWISNCSRPQLFFCDFREIFHLSKTNRDHFEGTLCQVFGKECPGFEPSKRLGRWGRPARTSPPPSSRSLS